MQHRNKAACKILLWWKSKILLSKKNLVIILLLIYRGCAVKSGKQFLWSSGRQMRNYFWLIFCKNWMRCWGGQRQTKMNTMFCSFFRPPYFGVFSHFVAFLSLFYRMKKTELHVKKGNLHFENYINLGKNQVSRVKCGKISLSGTEVK